MILYYFFLNLRKKMRFFCCVETINEINFCYSVCAKQYTVLRYYTKVTSIKMLYYRKGLARRSSFTSDGKWKRKAMQRFSSQ